MRANFVVILSSLVLVSGILGCSTSSSKPSSGHQQTSSPSPLRDACLLYEMGKLDAAEQKLQAILQTGPHNPAAASLLGLVREAEYRRESGQERPWGYFQTIPQQPIYR